MSDSGGFILPEEIDPDERLCVQIRIPNDRFHIAAFWGNLETLGRWWNWQRDEDKQGSQVAQVWQTVIADARNNWLNEGCEGVSKPIVKEALDEWFLDLCACKGGDGGAEEDPFAGDDPDEVVPGQIYTYGQQAEYSGWLGLWDGIENTVERINTYITDESPTQGQLENFLNNTLIVDWSISTATIANDRLGGIVSGLKPTDNQKRTMVEQWMYGFSGTQRKLVEVSIWNVLTSPTLNEMLYWLDAITDAQLQAWYDAGTERPREGVENSKNFRFPNIVMEWDETNGFNRFGFLSLETAINTPAWKERIIEVRYSGVWTDSQSGAQRDCLFKYSVDDDEWQWQPLLRLFSNTFAPENTNMVPPSNELSFNASHNYVYYFERVEQDNDPLIWQWSSDESNAFETPTGDPRSDWYADRQGTLRITIIDRGSEVGA